MSYYRFAFRALFMVFTAILSIDAVAQDAVNSDKELRILEKWLGTWDTKYIGKVGLSAESTYERILGGRYIQSTVTIRDVGIDYQMLELMTYSPGEKCYRMWTHFSDPRLPVIEHRGTWDEVTQTMTWEARLESGATRTTTIKYESESLRKTIATGKGPAKGPDGNLKEIVTEAVSTRRKDPK